MIGWEDFNKVNMHVGTVIRAEEFPEAHKAAIKLWIDFGPLGIKKSSAQITQNYQPSKLLGKQVVAVTNFPPKQIGPFISECLVLGLSDEENAVVLISPERKVTNGWKVS